MSTCYKSFTQNYYGEDKDLLILLQNLRNFDSNVTHVHNGLQGIQDTLQNSNLNETKIPQSNFDKFAP
jgi:hypothetical protein